LLWKTEKEKKNILVPVERKIHNHKITSGCFWEGRGGRATYGLLSSLVYGRIHQEIKYENGT
jgi:hypothetical protein